MFLVKRKKGSTNFGDDEQLVYWRKCNQIREWFAQHLEEGVANCEYSMVTKDDIENLIADCYMVLDHHSLASEILPTSPGFFFGSTDYDEWYFEDLQYTITNLLKALGEVDWDKENMFYYEWW